MQNLYLVRHGESQANADEEIYKSIPDHRIALTDKGQTQAAFAGKELNYTLQGSTRIVHSPWLRAKQTADLIKEQLVFHKTILLVEDPLIYEHSVLHSYEDMKNKEEYYSHEKYSFGSFWYKAGTSESLADVYARARIFVNDLKTGRYQGDNLIIVSHGLFILMVRGVLHNWSVQEILDLHLPNNCQILHEIISNEY